MDPVLASFDTQIGWCETLGSPFTAAVLGHIRRDIAEGGSCAALLGDWRGDPLADALPLRFAGAIHALALQGAKPELSAAYPPHAVPGPARLRQVLMEAIEEHQGFIAAFLASPPQTNEVGRSAVLLGGFLEVAAETRLPLRLLEIGASAGLNTIWDRYRYRVGAASWGDSASPVQLAPDWSGPLPRLDAELRVAARRACDLAPIDLEDPEQRLRLRAYVWADQRDRLQRLDDAMGLARASGTAVERADAATWVADRLSEPAPGCATVLYHSIIWQYMPPATRDVIATALDRAGRRATPEAPLGWLRFEASPESGRPPDLRLTLWPSGSERRLAEAQAHGSRIVWLG